MLKSFLFTLTLCSALLLHAQRPLSPLGDPNGNIIQGGDFRKYLRFPLVDSLTLNGRPDSIGAVVILRADQNTYVYKGNGKWDKLGSGSVNYYNGTLGSFNDTIKYFSDGSLLDIPFYTPGKQVTTIRAINNYQGVPNGSGFLNNSGTVGDSTHIHYSVSPYDTIVLILSGIIIDTNVEINPTGFIATPLNTYSIALTWNNAIHNNGYQIDWRLQDGTYQSLATLEPDDTAFVHSGIPPDTRIFYRVRTLGDSVFYGSNFTFTNARTAALVTLSTPSLTTTANNTEQITVVITPVAHARAYELLQGSDGVYWDTYDTLAPDATTIVLDSLTPGTQIFFKVRALGDDTVYAASVYSAIDSAATYSFVALSTPVITVDSTNPYTIFFHWAASSGAKGYLLRYSGNDTAYSLVASVGADTTSYVMGSLSPSTTYYLSVQALADSIFNSNSAIAFDSATTLAETTTISQLSTPVPHGTALNASQVRIDYNNVANETGYRIDQSLDKSVWTTIATPAANTSSYIVSGLQPSTTYYFRMIATADEITYTKSKLSSCNVTTLDTVSVTVPTTIHGALVNTGNTNNNYTGLNNLGLHLARGSYFVTQGTINFDNLANHGFKVFWTYNSDVPGAHSTLPTDSAQFALTLDSVLTEHEDDGTTDSIYAGAMINEINNLTYWVSTPENILNLVRACTQVYHEHGILAYDGGLPCGNPTLYLVWEDYKNRGKKDSADLFAAGAFPAGTNLTNWRTSSNYGPKIRYNETLIKGLADIPTDGLNIHWYEALLSSDATKAVTDPNIFIETAQYLMRTAHKTSIISNEYGLNNNNTISLMQQQVQTVKALHMKMALWYSGGSTNINGYGSLVGPTGAITSIGAAYKIEIAK